MRKIKRNNIKIDPRRVELKGGWFDITLNPTKGYSFHPVINLK